MKKQFIEHENDYAITELWNACMLNMPGYNDLKHLENAKNMHIDWKKSCESIGLTREFIKKRLNYYRKYNHKIYGYDNYISDFDIYFKPKKFFNSHWIKKAIKELNK